MKAPRTMDIVVRVSAVKGRDEDPERFMSPDEQEDVARTWADHNNVTVAEVHYELDVSGRTTEREGLQTAVDRALSGKTDGIIVAKVDRFARNLLAGLTAVGQLRRAKSTFVAVKDGIDGEQAFTSQGRLLIGILFLFAEWQLDSLTESWQDVRRRNVRNGVSLNPIFGYRKDRERRLHPDDTEARWVVRVFEGRAAGMSYEALADMLNEAGMRQRSGAMFTYARVRSMVHNERYLGRVTSGVLPNGEELRNDDAHEAIVTQAQWDAAHARPLSMAQRGPSPFLLSGIVRCASCGVRMTGRSDFKTMVDGREVNYRYYKCRRKHSFGTCPAPAQVKADDIEALVESWFYDLYLARREAVGTQIVGDEVATAQAEVDEAKAEIAAFMRHTRVSDDPEGYEEGVRDRRLAVRAAQDRLSEAKAAEMGVSYPADLADAWGDMDVPTRRGFISDGLVVAVAPGRAPFMDRTAIWAVNDPVAPTALPGIDGVKAITPLYVPAGPGEATS